MRNKLTVLAGLSTAAAVVFFVAAFLAKPYLEDITFPPAGFLVFHNMIELFTVIVAFAIFAVGWHTFRQSRNASALFLGIAFWAIGLLDLFHLLSYKGMPPLITPSSPTKSIYFWLAARLVAAVSLLVSGFISPENRSKFVSRPFLLLVFLPVPIITFIAVIYFDQYLPVVFVPQVGVTPLKVGIEYVITLLFALAALVYGLKYFKTRTEVSSLLISAFIISMVSELSFTLYISVFDAYNVLGHVFKFAAYSLIFWAVFIGSIRRPYAELSTMKEKLAQSHANLERLVEKRTEKLRMTNERLKKEVMERKRAQAARDCLFNFSLDMLAIAGFDGYFKELNPAWEKTLGWKKKELLSKPYVEFVHPEDRESTIKAATGLTKGQAAISFENRYRCKDGSYKWISWNSFPLVKEGLIFAVARDVTNLKKWQAELEASNKELESFSYSVSHDLRAPLRSIDGFSQALLEDYLDKLDTQGKDYLQRVRAASQRMAQLIDDVLKLSRVTRSEMRCEKVDLSAMAKEIVTDLKKTQPKRQVELVIAPRLHTKGDPVLLHGMLENLLGNAWKFTGRRRRARIEFGKGQYNGKPAYFVRDNGVGFNMAYASKLFAPFQRLHASDEFPGTGIGLATVQRIIARHGGRVWVEAAVDKGATFYFTLG